MKAIKQMTLRDWVKRGLELYPQSKVMRKAWVRKTLELLRNERHALVTGGFKASGFNK